MVNWNPELYLKFSEQRTRPAIDLALRARTLLDTYSRTTESLSVLDLGCGPGNSTAILADIFEGANLVGMDSSPEMIATAIRCEFSAKWLVADASIWEPRQKFDLVFSNAVLQWLPDQAGLLARMWSWLNLDGVLAVQVPGNGRSALHQALCQIAALSRWCPRMNGLDDAIRYQEPDFYYETLAPLGGSVDVWETTYWHVLKNPSSLIDWYAGTGMRPWLERLDSDAERQAFKDAVLEAAQPAYPVRKDGSVFFPFRRIFVTATKLASE